MLERDILQELDTALASETTAQVSDIDTIYADFEAQQQETPLFFHYHTIVEEVKKTSRLLSGIWFTIKYIVTCAFIFAILLVGTNYSAYFTIAKSYIMKEEVEQKQQSILNSVEAANIQKETPEEITHEEVTAEKVSTSSMKKYKKELDAQALNMNIEITPYENRVVIPKIGKNIPLVDIKNRTLTEAQELDNIFMKELENGVVRYPGSALPGEVGNSFIFGHSSNFPWMEWNYNDVFATLWNIENGDEIIIYYNQKKYTYKITEKRVITPGDVSVLKRNNDKKEVSIMTCWPIGTTYNRLIVTGELIES